MRCLQIARVRITFAIFLRFYVFFMYIFSNFRPDRKTQVWGRRESKCMLSFIVDGCWGWCWLTFDIKFRSFEPIVRRRESRESKSSQRKLQMYLELTRQRMGNTFLLVISDKNYAFLRMNDWLHLQRKNAQSFEKYWIWIFRIQPEHLFQFECYFLFILWLGNHCC